MSDLPAAEKKEIERELNKKTRNYSGHVNYGVLSILSLLVAVVLFIWGPKLMDDAISCMFSSKNSIAKLDMQTGFSIIIFGIIMVITAFAFAGAALATDRGGIMGALVLTLFILPLLFLIGSILFGVQIDSPLNSFNPAPVTTDITSTTGIPSVTQCK